MNANDVRALLDGEQMEVTEFSGVLLVKFDEKPSADTREILKDNGFYWQPRPKLWMYGESGSKTPKKQQSQPSVKRNPVSRTPQPQPNTQDTLADLHARLQAIISRG